MFILARAEMPETTALGAAIAAGRADGVDCWKMDSEKKSAYKVFKPKLEEKGE